MGVQKRRARPNGLFTRLKRRNCTLLFNQIFLVVQNIPILTMSSNLAQATWIGTGIKYGGMLTGFGYETTNGWMINLATHDIVLFDQQSMKIGLGLGGGVGKVFVLALNCRNPLHLVQDSFEAQGNVDIAVSLGSRWGEFARGTFRHLRPLMNLGRESFRTLAIGAANAGHVRDVGHQVFNAYSVISSGTSPQLICMDIPLAGAAIELSISSSIQKFRMLDYLISPHY